MKQHGEIVYDPDKNISRQRGRVCEASKSFHTEFSKRFYGFLGSYIFNKVNKLISIFSLNKNECKSKVALWLQGLDYYETEGLLMVLR
jgi:hypothetical protein